MQTNTAASAVSAARVFSKVLLVIFTVEVAVMFVLPLILPRTLPAEVRAIVDAALLTATAAPLLWWIVIEPIIKEQEVRRQAELRLAQTQAKLQLAAEIQKKLLPKSEPVLPGTDIAARLTPAECTSGDFYDFPSMSDGSIGIVIADVSGHGIDSALLVASASAYLRALTRSSHDVGDILTRLNEFLVEQSQEGRFITLFLGKIDPSTMSLSYAAAGHRAYHFDTTETVSMLEAASPPLGLVPGVTIPSADPISLRPGETLLWVTDGIEESASPEQELFGSTRVIQLIQSHQRLSSQKTLDLLYREAREFASGEPQLDDMTAIILKVLDT